MEVDKELPNVEAQGILPFSPSDIVPDEPYSIYSRNGKWFIVGIVAVAGFYRHVSSRIPLVDWTMPIRCVSG